MPTQWDSKKEVSNYFLYQKLNENIIINLFIILVGSVGNLVRILQKLRQQNLAPHIGQLENKYYGIVQEGSLEDKEY